MVEKIFMEKIFSAKPRYANPTPKMLHLPAFQASSQRFMMRSGSGRKPLTKKQR